MMNYVLRLALPFSLLMFSAGLPAQDVGKLMESVDKDKAADSVDVDKVKEAMGGN